jgi:hypothetical protein
MNVRRTAAGAVAAATLIGSALAASATSAAAHAPRAVTAQPTSGSWAIIDQDGVQRTSMWFDGSYLSACYGPADGQVAIEVRYSDGQTNKRIVPQFGCTSVGAFAGTGDVTAVRGLVGDFANPWHEVG